MDQVLDVAYKGTGDCMIVAILSDKGGTGKTTFATNLAGMCRTTMHYVLLLDADRQGGSYYWGSTRVRELSDSSKHVATRRILGDEFTRNLHSLVRGYEHVIIDLGVYADAEIDTALRMADRIIVPLQPSGVDIWTMAGPDGLIGEEKSLRGDTRELRAFALLNRVSTNSQDSSQGEVRNALDQCVGLEVPDMAVSDRIVFQQALTSGRTVHEYRPTDRAAQQEMENLYELVFDSPYS